jgi:hypothetical protein
VLKFAKLTTPSGRMLGEFSLEGSTRSFSRRAKRVDFFQAARPLDRGFISI